METLTSVSYTHLDVYKRQVIFLAVCSGCGIKKEQKKTIEDTKEKIYRECEMLAEGYRNIYENAVKENALYELSTIQKSMDYFGKYGYCLLYTSRCV